MLTQVFVAAKNTGDGGVSISYYDDKAVPEWDENHDEESFAESTITELKIESDGPVKIDKITTAFQYYLMLVDQENSNASDFKSKFGAQFPSYSLQKGREVGKPYQYIDVVVNGNVVYSFFIHCSMTFERLYKKIDDSKCLCFE